MTARELRRVAKRRGRLTVMASSPGVAMVFTDPGPGALERLTGLMAELQAAGVAVSLYAHCPMEQPERRDHVRVALS